jgi:hypothetical protein
MPRAVPSSCGLCRSTRSVRLGIGIFGLGVAALACATPARANAPAPFSRPAGAAAGIVAERQSPLLVEREEIVVDCAKEGEAPLHADCSFVATYFLYNPTAAEEEVLGAFYTAEQADADRSRAPAPTRVTALLDGADVRTQATDDQLARMDAVVREDPEIAALELGREPFRIVVGAGRRGQLVFAGPLPPIRYARTSPPEGYAIPAIVARHVALASTSSREWETSDEEFLYLISPLRGWAGDPSVHVTVRHHSSRGFTPASPVAGWTMATDGRVTTARAVVRASSKENLRFRVEHIPLPVHNGGPVVGIGPRIGREELRVRLGYEVGISSFLVLGASAETNFQQYVTAAMTLDAATPCVFFFIPSLAIGAGVPVQVRRGEPARVGARGQIGMSWPILSIVLPIDYYPVENSSGSHVEAAFLTQVSF